MPTCCCCGNCWAIRNEPPDNTCGCRGLAPLGGRMVKGWLDPCPPAMDMIGGWAKKLDCGWCCTDDGMRAASPPEGFWKFVMMFPALPVINSSPEGVGWIGLTGACSGTRWPCSLIVYIIEGWPGPADARGAPASGAPAKLLWPMIPPTFIPPCCKLVPAPIGRPGCGQMLVCKLFWHSVSPCWWLLMNPWSVSVRIWPLKSTCLRSCE